MSVRHRADVVGSLLGPAELYEARRAFAAGEIDARALKRAEDDAIDEVLRLQEEAGVDVVSDGELRRSHYVGPLIDACDGIGDKPAPARPYFDAAGNAIYTETAQSVMSRVELRRGLVTEEYTYARARTDKPVKVALPAPTIMANYWSPEHTREVYDDPFDLFADATEALRRQIAELARLGCTDVQIDAPELVIALDETHAAHWASVGIDPVRFVEDGIAMIDDLASHPSVDFALHLCKGSKHRGWAAAVGYDEFAARAFQRASSFSTFLLEYDDDRSGTFDALRSVPEDKTVVLGIVSTRRADLEPMELIEQRVAEAARHFPREQLAISTQCGFASGLVGDDEKMRFQRDKLALVAEAARRLWP